MDAPDVDLVFNLRGHSDCTYHVGVALSVGTDVDASQLEIIFVAISEVVNKLYAQTEAVICAVVFNIVTWCIAYSVDVIQKECTNVMVFYEKCPQII